MSDDNQTFVPPSFVALYQMPGRLKPRIPLMEIAQRHDLCEDLSQLLTETASHMLHTLHITETDVLRRSLDGLLGESSIVTEDEAHWVIHRLAELMQWTPLHRPPCDPASAAVSQQG